jgi:hypothetical protein
LRDNGRRRHVTLRDNDRRGSGWGRRRPGWRRRVGTAGYAIPSIRRDVFDRVHSWIRNHVRRCIVGRRITFGQILVGRAAGREPGADQEKADRDSAHGEIPLGEPCTTKAAEATQLSMPMPEGREALAAPTNDYNGLISDVRELN